jgi:hypothetical protein
VEIFFVDQLGHSGHLGCDLAKTPISWQSILHTYTLDASVTAREGKDTQQVTVLHYQVFLAIDLERLKAEIGFSQLKRRELRILHPN